MEVIKCPVCGNEKCMEISDGKYICRACDNVFLVHNLSKEFRDTDRHLTEVHNDLKQALQTLKKGLGNSNEVSVEEKLENASRLLELGEYDMAYRKYELIALEYPGVAEGWMGKYRALTHNYTSCYKYATFLCGGYGLDEWENPCYFEGNECVRNALACEGCDEEKIKTEVYDFLKKCYDCAEKELVRVDTELEERYKLYRKEENGRRKSIIINSVLEVVKYLTPVIVFSGVAGILIHNWICDGGFWNIVLSVLAGIIGVKVFFRLLKWGIKNSKMGIKLHKATSGMYDGVITKIVQEQKELFNMAQNYRYLSLVINDRNTFMQYYLSTDYRLHFCTGEEEIRDEEKASIFGYLKTMRERIRTEEREL